MRGQYPILSVWLFSLSFLLQHAAVPGEVFDLRTLAATTSVDPSKVTIGGFSSGACFAHQFHIIHSKTISGVGLLAPTPYNSLFPELWSDLQTRYFPILENLPGIILDIHGKSFFNQIDNVRNLAGDKVFIHHGFLDFIFRPWNSVNVKLLYSKFLSWSDIKLVIKPLFGHVWPTALSLSSNSNTCSSGGLPFVLGETLYRNCNYDTVYNMFSHLYGPVMAARPASPSGVLRQFDQTPFTPLLSGMDSIGTVYIPPQCENGATCKLHFSLHGCINGRSVLGDTLATNTEHMLWADVWDVILVFPNVKITVLPTNPTGCWDVMGYTGLNYGSVTVDSSKVTIGGFSSGACFAHQFHIIHSKTISGVGLLAPNIEMVIRPLFGHIWPTTQPGNSNVCWSIALPLVLQGAPAYRYCGYDTVYYMFSHLYGPVTASKPASPSGVLREFDQTIFTPLLSGMDSVGAVYIPPQCENGATCKLHFSLHACGNGRSTFGDAIATNTEYMLWADVWDVILVFPNVKITALPTNPTGCWDVMGYTGLNYAVRSAKQVRAIKAMMDTFL
ncbi:unnamed protein product [Cyprideis torosa]|uniref:Uncharacterized protein n=1 Tax=Cyprideis torosa TaxID=163714 RepID=A0A7R8ZLZ0_9CRUS|nr:unnamed protein product [Cyprideis torosa]CAG0887756.1 unnamed protein product [Cyprideis torosa]